MNNKKGYTLVEILIVIAVVAAIGVTATVGLSKTMNKSKQDKYNTMLENIRESANTYITLYPEAEEELYANESYTISIDTLKESLLIDENLKNPKTNELVNGEVLITYNPELNKIEYTLTINGVVIGKAYKHTCSSFFEKTTATVRYVKYLYKCVKNTDYMGTISFSSQITSIEQVEACDPISYMQCLSSSASAKEACYNSPITQKSNSSTCIVTPEDEIPTITGETYVSKCTEKFSFEDSYIDIDSECTETSSFTCNQSSAGKSYITCGE